MTSHWLSHKRLVREIAMRHAGCSIAFLVLAAIPLHGEEKKFNPREIDKQLFDVLKDLHNQGADIFNSGDASGCYRLFQGSLKTARAALAHRPADQKFIDDRLADAEKQVSVTQRGYILHEAIERLRMRLRSAPVAVKDKKELEFLVIPPRELKQEKKVPIPKKIVLPKESVMGRIIWKGVPLAGAEVTFVSRGVMAIKVCEGTSDAEGQYVLQRVRPGKYMVLMTKTEMRKQLLPERYSTATTTPLIVDVKGGGETLDFVLQ